MGNTHIHGITIKDTWEQNTICVFSGDFMGRWYMGRVGIKVSGMVCPTDEDMPSMEFDVIECKDEYGNEVNVYEWDAATISKFEKELPAMAKEIEFS